MCKEEYRNGSDAGEHGCIYPSPSCDASPHWLEFPYSVNGKLNIHSSKIIQKLKLYLSVSKNPDSLVTIQPVLIPFLSLLSQDTPLIGVSCTNFDTDLQERAQACFWPRHLDGLPCSLLKQVRTMDRLILDLKLEKKNYNLLCLPVNSFY